MIAFLRGRVSHKSLNHIILETNDIGYQVFVSENFLSELKIGEKQELYIHHQIKEDASDLYGFKTIDGLELFEMLISVSGVGPKSALGVMNIASVDDIKESIIRGDADLLTKVSGIGKKTAERLVLELKSKVLRLGGGKISTLNASISLGSDEIDALVSLGYSISEARDALNDIAPSIEDSAERVKAALRKMRIK